MHEHQKQFFSCRICTCSRTCPWTPETLPSTYFSRGLHEESCQSRWQLWWTKLLGSLQTPFKETTVSFGFNKNVKQATYRYPFPSFSSLTSHVIHPNRNLLATIWHRELYLRNGNGFGPIVEHVLDGRDVGGVSYFVDAVQETEKKEILE